jgi:hypothetical protein
MTGRVQRFLAIVFFCLVIGVWSFLTRWVTYGRQILAQTGTAVQVSYDGNAEWKSGGITINWNTVIPVLVDTTLADFNVIKAGRRGLLYGTVMVRLTTGYYAPWTAAETATTLNGATLIGATTFTLTSAANVFPGDSLLIDTAGQAETLEVSTVVGNVITTVTAALNTHANGVAVSKPDDGRQTLTIGSVGVLNESVLQDGPIGFGSGPTDHPGLVVGGRVWQARLGVGGTDQPTLANLLEAMPRLAPVIS